MSLIASRPLANFDLSSGWRVKMFLALLLIAAALLRLDFLLASNFGIESDEAVVGLMAKRWLDGQDLPIFYYGQHYMGSFEPLMVGLAFLFFGVSSTVLKLVPYFFSLLLLPLIYLLTREVSNRRAGLIAATLYAFGPAVLIIWSSKPRGGFIELLVVGTAAMIFFIRWWKHHRQSDLLLSSLLLGLGWWINNQIIYYLLPVGFFCLSYLLSDRSSPFASRLFNLIAASVSFLLGSALYWYYNFNEQFVSFEIFKQSSLESDLAEHFSGLFEIALPVILGSLRPWQSEAWIPGVIFVAYALLILFAIYWLILRRTSILKLLILRADVSCGQELLAMHCFCIPMIFALSSFGNFSAEPRYLLPIYTSLFPLYAIVLDRIWINRPQLSRILILLLLGISLGSCYFLGRAIPGEPFVYGYQRAARDHTELLAWLKTNNYTAVKTNYWIGYRLAFESKELVRFALFDVPSQMRIPSYENYVGSQPESQVPLILVPGQAVLVVQGLKTLGYKYKRVSIGGYVVIYNLRRPPMEGVSLLIADQFSLEASSAQESLYQAVDGQLDTRWGSATPQNRNMFFSVKFKQSIDLRALEYELGHWESDYPRRLRIIVKYAGGGESEIINPRSYRALSYLLSGSGNFVLTPHLSNVIEVTFFQEGEDPIFDWSIAELRLYGFTKSGVNE